MNDRLVRANGSFVLYWMTANRRIEWNFALQRAVDWAHELRQPLVILEALHTDYPWACDRLHRFVMDGMAEKQRCLMESGVSYYPYVEPKVGASSILFTVLAAEASVVVGDDSPIFFYPAMLSGAAARLPVRLEVVDASGLLPLSVTKCDFTSAYVFRRFLQKTLESHLDRPPMPDPLADIDLPVLKTNTRKLVTQAYPTPLNVLEDPAMLSTLPIDHDIANTAIVGGSSAARVRLHRFVNEHLLQYGQKRNQPDGEHASQLSAYLHFGHISPHEIFSTIAAEETWSPANLATFSTGARQGWWGMSESSEAFLDQLVTWRELGFNMCYHRSDYDAYTSLPPWALATLEAHRGDERPHTYSLAEFEASATHDTVWNAAQNQLVVEGRIHNYLRMLWGKKILGWSASPEDALQTMLELNNKYALDGRDPNSYSGIFWVLGRYDRPWGPERPVFGKVRYMSSTNTARKLRLKEYLKKYTPPQNRGAAA